LFSAVFDMQPDVRVFFPSARTGIDLLFSALIFF
jgi:hypothetical protein